MPRFKIIDEKKIQFTKEEEAEADKLAKAWSDGKADRELAKLREQRNILLAETDYMGNSDVTMSVKWKTYRQELRDITKTFKSLNDKDFKFPDKPKE